MVFTLEEIGKIATMASLIIGGGWMLYEFRKKRNLKKFDLFIRYREKLKTNTSLIKIVNHVQNYLNHPELKSRIEAYNISLHNFYYFLGFYKEISLLYQQRLISRKLAKEMFVWYAIEVAKNDNYWRVFGESYVTDDEWKNFKFFVNEMQKKKCKYLPIYCKNNE